LFLTVSQSPLLEELRELIWGFLSGCEAGNPVPDCNFPFEGSRKLVILDDVWTTQALDRLTSFKFPGCTTLVVSRSKLTEPKFTYDVEVLSEDEAISLFCLCAFGQKSIPLGFCKDLVNQVILIVSSPTPSIIFKAFQFSEFSVWLRLLMNVKGFL